MRITTIPIAVFLLGLAIPAQADIKRDEELCGTSEKNHDIVIGACTRLIQSGRYEDFLVAVAFYNRGNSYKSKGQYDRAIQDYDQAIRLDPKHAYAFGNRAWVYEKMGRRDKAIRDYKKVYDLGIRPDWLVEKLRKFGALP